MRRFYSPAPKRNRRILSDDDDDECQANQRSEIRPPETDRTQSNIETIKIESDDDVIDEPGLSILLQPNPATQPSIPQISENLQPQKTALPLISPPAENHSRNFTPRSQPAINAIQDLSLSGNQAKLTTPRSHFTIPALNHKEMQSGHPVINTPPRSQPRMNELPPNAEIARNQDNSYTAPPVLTPNKGISNQDKFNTKHSPKKQKPTHKKQKGNSRLLPEASESSAHTDDRSCEESDNNAQSMFQDASELYRSSILGVRNKSSALQDLRTTTAPCPICARFAEFLHFFKK
jgi:hypothetical protein